MSTLMNATVDTISSAMLQTAKPFGTYIQRTREFNDYRDARVLSNGVRTREVRLVRPPARSSGAGGVATPESTCGWRREIHSRIHIPRCKRVAQAAAPRAAIVSGRFPG